MRNNFKVKPGIMEKDITLVILAAGMGSRYGGLKQLDQIGPGGETIIEYSVYDAIEAGFNKVVFIIRDFFAKAFQENLGDKFSDFIQTEYVNQPVNVELKNNDAGVERTKPWGTSHAVLVARDLVDEPFAVINADDYYGRSAFSEMAEFLRERVSPDFYAMIGYVLKNTLSDQGHVNRGVCITDQQGYLTAIEEVLKIRQNSGKIVHGDEGIVLSPNARVSMNFWGFHPKVFQYLEEGFKRFYMENRYNPSAEYYIPLIVDELIRNEQIKLKVIPSEDKWYGITYKDDAVTVRKAFLEFRKRGLYPDPLWSTLN
jgi:NDP-sugar pyrophosphorylase family protein